MTRFFKVLAEDKANIAACGKAITAIEKGMAGMFLQSGAANTLKNLVINRDLDRYSRRVLTDFLSTSTGYAPASGEIVGILKQLLEDMEKELAEVIDEENAAVAEFESLVSAKEKEIQAATEAVETKTEKNGEYAVKIVNLKNDDDDALDLFKKTLPSPSLLQVTDTRDIRDSALQALAGEKGQVSQKLGFIELALMGKKVSFDKVIKMMDDMVVLLKEEQKDDEAQKEWCET